MNKRFKTFIIGVICVCLLASMAMPIASASSAVTPIEILSPWGVINPPLNVPLAERNLPVNLADANIGLIWFENLYTGPLDRVGSREFASAIRGAFPNANFENIVLDEIRVNYQTATWYDDKAAELDAVIVAMADSTNTAYWAAAYARQFEKRAVPSVVLTTSTFSPVLEASAQAHGITELRSVVIPATRYARAFANMTASSVLIVNEFSADIQNALSTALTPAERNPQPIVPPNQWETHTIPAQNSFGHQVRYFNQLADAQGFGDGLPLTLPTRQAVDTMLASTTRNGDEVLGILRHRFGVATVEKVAVNAVMAGAPASVFPIILAAMEAIIDGIEDESLFHYAWTSGDDYTLFVLLSGPIARELEFYATRGALGPGTTVQSTIGRAILLSFQNIGHNTRGDINTGRAGAAWGFTGIVMAENVSEFPGAINPDFPVRWEEHHETMGFSASDSVVTVAAVGRYADMHDTVRGWIFNFYGGYLLTPAHWMLRDARVNFAAGAGAIDGGGGMHSLDNTRRNALPENPRSSRDATFLLYNPDNVAALITRPEAEFHEAIGTLDIIHNTSRLEFDFGRPIIGGAHVHGPRGFDSAPPGGAWGGAANNPSTATQSNILLGNILLGPRTAGGPEWGNKELLRQWFATHGISGNYLNNPAHSDRLLVFADVQPPASASEEFIPFAAHSNVVLPIIAGQYPSYARGFQSKGLGMDAMRSQLVSGATITQTGQHNPAPSQPRNFTATVTAGNAVTLAWEAPARLQDTLLRYEVSKDNGATWVSAGTDLTFTFDDIDVTENHQFVVRAVSDIRNSAVYTWIDDDVLELDHSGSGRGAQARALAVNATFTLSFNIFNNGNNNNASLANMGIIRMWPQINSAGANLSYANLTVSAEDQDGEDAMGFVRVNRIWNDQDYVSLIDVNKHAPWQYIDMVVEYRGQEFEVRLINNMFLSLRAFNNGTCDEVPSMAGNIRIWPQLGGVSAPIPMSAVLTAVDQSGGDALSLITRNRQWVDGTGWQDNYLNFDVDKNANWQTILLTISVFGQTVEVLLTNNLFEAAPVDVLGLQAFNNGNSNNASLANAGIIRIWTQLNGVNALVPFEGLRVTAYDQDGDSAMGYVRVNRIWNNMDYVNLIDVTKRDANWETIDLTVKLGSGQVVELHLVNDLF
ncbi:MAG: fibronectin type III domain-containing protein [Oscillospiraceae bacterium]|nr:fibronectin type III domain-containing protein [Oscillospiraceae bacterium]